MEINLVELTLTSFNLTEFTTVNNLVVMVTMENNPNPQFSKARLTTLNLNNFKISEAIGLEIRPPLWSSG
jgi:hypothetical protein